MRRTITAGLVAVLTATTLAAGGTPASATTCDPVITGPDIPNVVLTTTGRAAVLVSVRVQQACVTSPFDGIYGVNLTAQNPGQDVASTYLSHTSGTQADGTWSGTLSFDKTNNVGTWSVDVSAQSSTGQTTNVAVDTFRLRRNTLLHSRVGPATVQRGGSVRVSGRLQRLTVGLHYVSWRHKEVRIYFQRAGRTARTLVGTAQTGRGGRFHTSVTALHTGRWYAYFTGSTTNTSKFSAGHRVVVTR
jgi:hypothetical protein